MPATPLRSWRVSRGLSIRELEKRTKINRGRLSGYERGLPVPAEDMRRIEAELGYEGGTTDAPTKTLRVIPPKYDPMFANPMTMALVRRIARG